VCLLATPKLGIAARYFMWVLKLKFCLHRRTMDGGVAEQDAKEKLWMQEREGIRVGWRNCTEMKFIICIFHELFLGQQLDFVEMRVDM